MEYLEKALQTGFIGLGFALFVAVVFYCFNTPTDRDERYSKNRYNDE